MWRLTGVIFLGWGLGSMHVDTEMKTYYAARAPYYDAVYEKPERRADIAFLSAHLPSRLSGLDVLEVACGTGYWTQHIAPAAQRYVATDAVLEPMEFAKLRPGVNDVQFVQADAYDLPKHLEPFTAAFAGFWFSHIPIEQRARFIAGLHGLLLPGARVIFIDNSEVQCRELPVVECDEHGNTYQSRPLRDGSCHRVLKNFPSERELRVLVSALGARAVQFKTLDNFWVFEYQVNAVP